MSSDIRDDTRAGFAELFGREVDLITEPALENPYLRRRVEAQRRRLVVGAEPVAARHDQYQLTACECAHAEHGLP